MFTGIVEEIGTIKSITDKGNELELEISALKVTQGTKIGDSIATNGVCLTVTGVNKEYFKVYVMPQTYKNTSLRHLKIKSKVNLERALTLQSRLGGHIVSGHIDKIGYIKDIKKEKDAVVISISTDKEMFKYIINKGSISIDGISLTIMHVDKDLFKVSIIPQTQNDTTLVLKNIGDIVNLEFDIFGKYIENFLNINSKLEKEGQSSISNELLAKCGYL